MEKPTAFSHNKFAYLIRNYRPDRLVFLKTQQRKKDHFSSLKVMSFLLRRSGPPVPSWQEIC